ncbi:MAG: glycoside hydrolase family 38, partial [Casimicrobium sp.]
MSKSTKPRLHVVMQTHWDREWYLPQQTTVARLIEVMERVAAMLERGELQSFLFDGQTAALEDLLDYCEDTLAERVRKLLRAGKLVIGPWYVMADEFLVCGESLLRNLEIGQRDVARFGSGQRVGYLPDTFGHIGQMPHILREFGIDSAVVWRGADEAHSEFDWVAKNGDRVGALFLTQGYYQHPFNVDNWQAAIDAYVAQIKPRALSSELLLTQGGDHLLPHADFASRFSSYEGEVTLVQSTLESAVQVTLAATDGKRADRVGELRSNREAFVLPDVLSTRRYLKQLHQRAEDRLLYEVEPLLAALHPAANFPHRYVENTWRLLLQQQAHDSICGCSVDEVHAEMQTRFVQLDQRLDALVARACSAAGVRSLVQHASAAHAVRALNVFADDATFTIFNPLPQTFEAWFVTEIFLRGERIDGLQLRAEGADRAGLLDDELLRVEVAEEFHSPLDDFPERFTGHRYTFALRLKMSGLSAIGLIAYRPISSGNCVKNDVFRKYIENDLTRVYSSDKNEIVVESKT